MSEVEAVAGSTNAPAATAASGPASAGTSDAAISSATQVNSMADLKNLDPKFYNSMMQFLAQNICEEMKKHQDKLKEMMREGQRTT